MAWSQHTEARGSFYTYSGYTTVSGISWELSLPTFSDLWTTGVYLSFVVHTGGTSPDCIDPGSQYIDTSVYNPWNVTLYMSGDDLKVYIPTWSEFCSGWLTATQLSALNAEIKSGLTESGVNSLLYKYVGKMYNIVASYMSGRTSYINISGF